MKPLIVLLGVFFLASGAWAAALPSPGEGPGALARWFAALGPRREGSEGEARVFAALGAWFGPRAGVQTRGFQDQDEFHSFSRQFWFRVAGRAPGELVVVVPTDGTNDRGLAWAAAWADRALDQGTELSLTFLFTGAERGDPPAGGQGSRTFLQDFYPELPAAVIYLDAGGPDNEVKLNTESGIYPSPLWMVRGLTQAFESQGLSLRLAGSSPSLFRLDLPERRNILQPWFERSIPGIWISAGPADPSVVQALVGFTGTQGAGVPQTWDRHYLVFDFGSGKVFWGQGTYLGIFLVVAALVYFGYAVLGRRRRGTLRNLGPGLWQWPALLAVLFLCLWSGTALALGLLDVRGGPNLWKTSALTVWTFKTLAAITLYLAVFLPFRRSPLGRDPDFYGQSALVWLGAMVLGAAAFELSFSFYFLWALVWAAVLVLAPWRPVKLLALAAGPLWLFKAAYDILGPHPDLDLARWILVSPVAGNLVLAVLLFPFLLQVNSWHFSGHRHQDRNDGLRAGIQLTLWALATLVAAFLVLRVDPEGAPKVPAPTEHLDIPNRTLDIGSPARPLPFDAGGWETRVASSAFLDRTVWKIALTGPRSPETLDLTLVGDGPLTVFDCNFPVVLEPRGTRASVLIGRQPNLPLTVQLTLPAQTRAQVEIRAKFAGGQPLEIRDLARLGP